MPVFRFKHFSVSNERSAMKVNTDGVLLGALMRVLPSDRHLLDIGTGTGTIALMAAQRLAEAGSESSVSITAIDIDAPSAEEARVNFAASPWSEWLASSHESLEDFAKREDLPAYDLIFSNPPYFESSLKAPQPRRRVARHADTLSYREIISFAAKALCQGGRLALILPFDTMTQVRRYAASWGLLLARAVLIRSTPSHPVSRTVLEFSREQDLSAQGAVSPVEEQLTIRNEEGYSEEYRSLTSEFLLI